MVANVRVSLFLVGLIWLLGALLALPALAQEDREAGEDREVLRPVRLMEISSQGAAIERTFFGRVVARQTVDLAFQVGGQILDLPAVEGAEIAAGELIAALDLEPFELAEAEAEAQLAQARRTVTRFEQLQGAAVSEVALRDAATEQRLGELALQEARRALRLATLRAPFDALVAAREVANFTTISPGTPVVRLHDMSELRVEINVPELLFQRAGKSPDVEITARFPVSPRSYRLELREFVAETSRVGQTYLITLAFAEQPDLTILPGTSVTVRARLGRDQGSLYIPAAALVETGDGGTGVYVFSPTGADEGRLSLRRVEIAVAADGRFELVSGLQPGEEIVAAGANLVADGQRVARFSGFSD